jgi:NAD(P)-dependent dehydrogenase (short-subunit alcohol dehydrogenase family)
MAPTPTIAITPVQGAPPRVPRQAAIRTATFWYARAMHLVFVTGGSSGIGLALVRNLPFEDARVIDISRRGAPGVEHFAADLADPASWPRVAELFERELEGFAGQAAYLLHSAGSLEPIGFAGEVDPQAYTRQVLLNSAAPQVIFDAFLRAARHGQAPCTVLNIGSGAARSVYEGWSAYCGGKAAVDHWIRTVGAEQRRRGSRCRLLSVAPGVVATAMQAAIRATPERDFPELARFQELHAAGELRDADSVARELWELLERELENGAVIDLRDAVSEQPPAESQA